MVDTRNHTKFKCWRLNFFIMEAIVHALEKAKRIKGKPVMIIAHTIKGKGVSFMENDNHYHGVAPTQEESARALKELEGK